MCLLTEVQQTTRVPAGLASEAWMNRGISESEGGLRSVDSCSHWITENPNSADGSVVAANGNFTGLNSCTIPSSTACCALVP